MMIISDHLNRLPRFYGLFCESVSYLLDSEPDR